MEFYCDEKNKSTTSRTKVEWWVEEDRAPRIAIIWVWAGFGSISKRLDTRPAQMKRDRCVPVTQGRERPHHLAIINHDVKQSKHQRPLISQDPVEP